MYGFTMKPLFAIAENATASCKVLTATSCPIDIWPIEILLHSFSGFNLPAVSPAMSKFVGVPNPNNFANL